VGVTEPAPSSLPPDPEQYDAVRNEHARKRGLAQPYIAGGDDPDLPQTLATERRYTRLLVAMVVGIVALGFVLGIAAALITGPS
jgi:adenine/guanine phosphoribosyltransferase-like PRPP-binding protein